MGQYSDFFIAAAEDAKAIGEAEDPFDAGWPHLQLKGVLLMELDALFGVLKGSPEWTPVMAEQLYASPGLESGRANLNELSDEDYINQLASESMEGVLIHRVADGFLSALCTLDASALPGIVKAWRRALDPLPLARLPKALEELVAFAKQARAAGRPMLLMSVL